MEYKYTTASTVYVDYEGKTTALIQGTAYEPRAIIINERRLRGLFAKTSAKRLSTQGAQESGRAERTAKTE